MRDDGNLIDAIKYALKDSNKTLKDINIGNLNVLAPNVNKYCINYTEHYTLNTNYLNQSLYYSGTYANNLDTNTKVEQINMLNTSVSNALKNASVIDYPHIYLEHIIRGFNDGTYTRDVFLFFIASWIMSYINKFKNPSEGFVFNAVNTIHIDTQPAIRTQGLAVIKSLKKYA